MRSRNRPRGAPDAQGADTGESSYGRWSRCSKPRSSRREPETVAYITMHGSYDQIPQGYGELYGWVAQHGLQPSGPPHAVYLTPPAADGTRTGVGAVGPVAEAGDVQPDAEGVGVKHVPEHAVAATMHRGSIRRDRADVQHARRVGRRPRLCAGGAARGGVPLGPERRSARGVPHRGPVPGPKAH